MVTIVLKCVSVTILYLVVMLMDRVTVLKATRERGKWFIWDNCSLGGSQTANFAKCAPKLLFGEKIITLGCYANFLEKLYSF